MVDIVIGDNYYPYYPDSAAGKTGRVQTVDRPILVNCSYSDKYGIRRYATEDVGLNITAAAAWSCLRKSWKGYKIAAGKMDEDLKVVYARRIIGLCRLLDLDEPEFLELYEWPTGQAAVENWMRNLIPLAYAYTDGRLLESNSNINDYYNNPNSYPYGWY